MAVTQTRSTSVRRIARAAVQAAMLLALISVPSLVRAQPIGPRSAAAPSLDGTLGAGNSPAGDPTSAPYPAAGASDPASAPTPTTRALALGATLIPGVLLHGSGHYVLGRTQAAAKLLAVEAVGLGLLIAGVAPLVAFNASRYLSRSSATLSGLGAGFFVVSSLADLYGVAAPLDSRGSSPLTTPVAEAELGYRLSYAPSNIDHLLVTQLDLRWQRLHLQPSLWHAVAGRNSRQRLMFGYRPYGPIPGDTPANDGSFIELTAAVTAHSFPTKRLTTITYEVFSHGRLDLRRVDPAFEGMFGIMGLGMAAQTFHYADADGSDVSSLLLLRSGFGVYLGGSTPPHGEILSYYDHRHDDYAGGINDRAIGIPGHVGFSGRGYFSSALGMSAMAELGANWITGLSLLVRSPL